MAGGGGDCERWVRAGVCAGDGALAGDKVTNRILLPPRAHTTHRIVIEGAPVEVVVNDGSVPEVVSSSHSSLIEGGNSELAS